MAYPGPFPFKVEQGGTGEITLLANAVLIGQNPDDIGVTNVGTNGQVLLGATAAAPAFATLTSTGGTVTFTLGANSLNLETAGSLPTVFHTGSGDATPSAGAITMAGGSNISTSGSGSTVTYSLSGIIPIANGGTNASSMATTDGTVIFDGTRLVTTATGTLGQVLTSNGAGVAPTYQAVSASGAVTSVTGGNNITITGTATAPIVNVSGTTNHAVQVGNASGSLTSLSVGATNTVLLGNTGADPSFGQVPNAALVNSSITLSNGSNITVTGSPVSLGGTATIALSGVVPIANGGTNASSMATTDGTIIFDGTRLVTTATGTSGQVLTSNGVGVAPTYQSVSASGAVTSVSGGNNITITGTATAPIVNVSGTTNHAVQVGNSTNSLTSLSVGTNGQVLLGSTGADPSFITPTAGTGLSITTNATTLQYALSTPVSVSNGGTGASSFTAHSLILGQGTSAMTALGAATNGQLPIGSTGADPVLATLTAGTGVSISNGAGSITISASATTPLVFHTGSGDATPAANAVTIAGGNNISTTGSGSTVTVAVSGTTNHTVQVGNSSGSLTSLTAGTNGQVLLGSTGADPAFITPTAGTGLSITTNATTLQYALSTPVSIANGGTNATSMATTDGTVIFDGTRLVTTATGTSGQVLTSNGAGVAPTYQAAAASSISITGNSGGALTGNSFTFTGGTTGLTFAGAGTTETLGGTLVVANGGTGATTFTAHSILLGQGTSAITALGAATNGQIPIGSTGVDPVLSTITAGSGITVTNGAGSITIAASGGAGMTWTEVTGASASMAVNNGYIANNAGLVTLTLPSTAAVGDVVRVSGKGAGGWRIAQNSGQTIFFGTSTTTTGATGRLDSSQRRDGIELLCVTANNDWNVLSAQGNITVT